MTEAANEPSYPICPECETVAWCWKSGCIPVTDPVDEELADAIADLCRLPLVHLAVSTSNVASRASDHTSSFVIAAAPTGQGRPL